MKNLLIIFIIALVFTSCNNDDYLIDGGVSNAEVGKSTLTYLKSHPQLDTFAILLDRAGLASTVEGETTVFVANNLSINRYVDAILTELREEDPTATYTIDDIPQDTLKKYMGGYIFEGKITREDLKKEGKVYTALNGEQHRLSLEPVSSGRISYSGNLSNPPEYVYFTYKGGSDWDAWDKISDDTKIIIRTSNLISTNGMIHVLQGTHVLFNYKSK
ncbi:MAG: fasciclin domain-containing protein [Bacteroidales bacterium]